MQDISELLYIQIRQALLDCDEISDPAQLRAILRTSRLRPFANSIKVANNPGTQVDYIIGDLAERQLTTGENALILLLEMLANRYDLDDTRHNLLLRLVTASKLDVMREDLSPNDSSKRHNHQNGIRQLRTILASLYPDVTSARRIADDAGLPFVTIDFTGNIQNIWYSIIGEAQKHSDGVERLIEATLVDYKDYVPLLKLRQTLRG